MNKYKLLKKLINNKQYDEIYEIFGKNIYLLVSPISHRNQDIDKLLKNNDYGTIYKKYSFFDKLTIRNYKKRKKEAFNQLFDENKYFELVELYNINPYNYLEILGNDVYYETGNNFKMKLYQTKSTLVIGLKQCLKALASACVLFVTVGIGVIRYSVNCIYTRNSMINKDLLQQYNKKITRYADEINKLQLDNDLDVIMKVMYDMWDEMEGYDDPIIDIPYLGRLAFTKKHGIGVCRNIADDFTARMNAINPDYNARNIAVYFNGSDYNINSYANIKTIILDNNVGDGINLKDEDDSEALDPYIFYGNHMVTILKPKDKDYILVVDPTNPSIGVIKNGGIYLFSNTDGKGLYFTSLGQIVCVKNCENVFHDFLISIVNRINNRELEKLSNEWGHDAQNNSLEKIKKL